MYVWWKNNEESWISLVMFKWLDERLFLRMGGGGIVQTDSPIFNMMSLKGLLTIAEHMSRIVTKKL